MKKRISKSQCRLIKVGIGLLLFCSFLFNRQNVMAAISPRAIKICKLGKPVINYSYDHSLVKSAVNSIPGY
jgi:hypothetical protein